MESKTPLVMATHHPTGSRRGLVERAALPQKPLAEASGMTRGHHHPAIRSTPPPVIAATGAVGFSRFR